MVVVSKITAPRHLAIEASTVPMTAETFVDAIQSPLSMLLSSPSSMKEMLFEPFRYCFCWQIVVSLLFLLLMFLLLSLQLLFYYYYYLPFFTGQLKSYKYSCNVDKILDNIRKLFEDYALIVLYRWF